MNVSTQAIVLHLAKVNDKVAILHLFTRDHGRVPYYIYGIGSAHKRNRLAQLFMPLTLLDIEAVHLQNRDIQQLKEFTPSYVATQLNSDIRRQTEALFIAEMIFNTLVHPMPDPILFDFLTEVVHHLDQRPDPENVHLEFLVSFLEQLGFGIDPDNPSHRLFRPLFDEEHKDLTRLQRQVLLRALMDYYQQHVPAFRMPHSLDIMTQVFA